jgi:hypothetical protein
MSPKIWNLGVFGGEVKPHGRNCLGSSGIQREFDTCKTLVTRITLTIITQAYLNHDLILRSSESESYHTNEKQ